MPPQQTQPQVKVGDIVHIFNEGTTIFRGMWDMVDVVVPPSGEDYISFEMAKLFFGDPRSNEAVRSAHDIRGVVGFIPDRPSEVRRLRLMYDHGFGDYTGKEGPETVWEANKIPHIRVETLKGERIWTVLDDPAGTTVIPALVSQQQDQDLRELVRKQGQMITSLMDRLGLEGQHPAVYEVDAPRENVYDTDLEEIVPRPDIPTEDAPTIYDQLPEDR